MGRGCREHGELRVRGELAGAQTGLAGRAGEREAAPLAPPESLQLVGLNDGADQRLAALLLAVSRLRCCCGDCVAVVILLRHFIERKGRF